MTRYRTAVAALLGFVALAVPVSGALAGSTMGKGGTAVVISTHTVTPKPQRTVKFNGYAKYTFSAPKGRHIVSASAKITGAQAHAVVISAKAISKNRTSFTVSLTFPGEQGNPGKLIVRLGTTG